MSMMRLMVAVLVVGFGCGLAQAQSGAAAGGAAQAVVVPTPGRAPAVLPGKGLAQHDFVYSGESHDRKIFIVRGGEGVWSYEEPSGKGEISHRLMLPHR